jgi:chromosome segregation ATPase
MGGGDIERLFDAVERINNQGSDTLRKLTAIETEQRYLKENIIKLEQTIKQLEETLNILQVERAQEKGKWIGACAVGTTFGSTLFYLLEKIGVF